MSAGPLSSYVQANARVTAIVFNSYTVSARLNAGCCTATENEYRRVELHLSCRRVLLADMVGGLSLSLSVIGADFGDKLITFEIHFEERRLRVHENHT